MATAFRSAQVLLRRQVLATAPKSMRLSQPMQQLQTRNMTKASRVLRAAEEESASRKHQAQTTGTRIARLKNSMVTIRASASERSGWSERFVVQLSKPDQSVGHAGSNDNLRSCQRRT